MCSALVCALLCASLSSLNSSNMLLRGAVRVGVFAGVDDPRDDSERGARESLEDGRTLATLAGLLFVEGATLLRLLAGVVDAGRSKTSESGGRDCEAREERPERADCGRATASMGVCVSILRRRLGKRKIPLLGEVAKYCILRGDMKIG